MPGATIGIQTGYGFPGQPNRIGYPESRTRPVKSTSGNIYFGDPVVENTDGSVQNWGAANVAADFAGVAMRRVKSAALYPQQANAYYAPKENCDVFLSGRISAKCTHGTPTVGGAVYIRTVVDAGVAPNSVVGSFEATAQENKNIALTNAKWGTGPDSDGVAELVITGQQGV